STPDAIQDIGNLPVMTLAVASDGHREFVHYFTLDGSAGRQASPQNSSRFYTLEAGVLPLAGDKPYLFAFGPGDAEIDMTRVDLLLIGSKRKLDDAILQTGYG